MTKVIKDSEGAYTAEATTVTSDLFSGFTSLFSAFSADAETEFMSVNRAGKGAMAVGITGLVLGMELGARNPSWQPSAKLGLA